MFQGVFNFFLQVGPIVLTSIPMETYTTSDFPGWEVGAEPPPPPSVFVKRRQPAKIATYFVFCASYFDRFGP